MGKPKTLFPVAVLCVVIATPVIRQQFKSQNYLVILDSGVILEATQRLKGSVFEDARILLVDYLPKGATGLVLNQSTSDGSNWGGPVAPHHRFWLSYHPLPGHFKMTGSKPTKENVDKSRIVVAFNGYAGWGAQQLDSEIGRGDWQVYPANVDTVLEWLSSSNTTNKN